jgi:hypothetical protein
LLQTSKKRKKRKKGKIDVEASSFFFFSALFTKLSLKKKSNARGRRARPALCYSQRIAKTPSPLP